MKGLYFLIGVAVGAAGTYFLLKEKYKMDEKEFYTRRYDERTPEINPEPSEEKEPVNTTIPEKPDIMEYAKKLASERYTTKEEAERPKTSAYIITKDEFGNEHYDQEALIFYSDGVLAYEATDNMVEDADEIVGTEYQDHFGEEEEDTVFVRNEDEMIEFEIIKDKRTYEEVTGNSKPHGSEDE